MSVDDDLGSSWWRTSISSMDTTVRVFRACRSGRRRPLGERRMTNSDNVVSRVLEDVGWSGRPDQCRGSVVPGRLRHNGRPGGRTAPTGVLNWYQTIVGPGPVHDGRLAGRECDPDVFAT